MGALALVPSQSDRDAAKQLMERGAYLDSAQVIWTAAPQDAFVLFLAETRAGGVCAVDGARARGAHRP